MSEMKTLIINGQAYQMVGYPPYLSENSMWMVYDPEVNSYVDTGISGIGPKGERGPAFHAINESAKVAVNPVTLLGSYATEPRVDDFVITTECDLYIVTGVDLETQLVEVTLLVNLKGKDGYTPVKGTDYYTEADKTEMVNLVLAALPDGDEVSY